MRLLRNAWSGREKTADFFTNDVKREIFQLFLYFDVGHTVNDFAQFGGLSYDEIFSQFFHQFTTVASDIGFYEQN